MSYPKCDRLAIGSSWRGNDLFLSVDGSAYAAIWYSKPICRRGISGSCGDTAIGLARPSRTECRGARPPPFGGWHRDERGAYPFHRRRVLFGHQACPADGTTSLNIVQRLGGPTM